MAANDHGTEQQNVRLDLNSPRFQQDLFDLSKKHQRSVLNTLRKLSKMTWKQVHSDPGLQWEAIRSRTGPIESYLLDMRLLGEGICRDRILDLETVARRPFADRFYVCSHSTAPDCGRR